MPIALAPRSMPLPFSVSRAATLPTIVTSSPSRIHTVPRPITTRQWKRDHGSRSRRAGICVVTRPRFEPPASIAALLPRRTVPQSCSAPPRPK
jgi:hypothetical protein